ncbi:MAG: rRNA pseudouridine synthase [Haloplasmataceae bacterium]|jgi:16S rRNA pseudouridine516 synthase|nr:rRNA pseudouridine synthase [Haloplasmataceae bacterium]
MRIDKLLSNLKYGTRNEIKKIIKEKQVKVNDVIVKDSGLQVDVLTDQITIFDQIIEYKEFVYLMLHKPKGYISATEDNMHKTVIDLIDDDFKIFDPFPCGRLDIDTEGLIILSNDGQFAHKMLHPKKEIYKKYYAEVDGVIENSDVDAFYQGLEILDGENKPYVTKKAKLDIITENKAYVYICEGKFHQVKRMFQKCNKRVTYLKRESIGKLKLDENLQLGDYRELHKNELDLLFENESIFMEV